MRSCSDASGAMLSSTAPLSTTLKPTPGDASAMRETAFTAWRTSVADVLRNFRRAGVL